MHGDLCKHIGIDSSTDHFYQIEVQVITNPCSKLEKRPNTLFFACYRFFMFFLKLIFHIIQLFRKSSVAHTIITVCVLFHVNMFDHTQYSLISLFPKIFLSEIVSEYDQEIPQSQTADKLRHSEEEPHNNHETPGRRTKQSNQLSLPHQDGCKTRMNLK